MNRIALFYTDIAVGGTSNKVYSLQIEKWNGGYVVNYQHGRRGGTQQNGTKTKMPVSLAEAEQVFNEVVAEKTKNGYKPEAEYECAGATVPAPMPKIYRNETEYPVELLDEITEAETDFYIRSPLYWFQVKENGHRRQVAKTAAGIVSYNKKGQAKPLPAETAAALAKLPFKTFHMDGELVGNRYIAFDLLMVNGVVVAKESYEYRYDKLAQITVGESKLVSIVANWTTEREKRKALQTLRDRRAEGVAIKRKDAAYGAGQHKKFKFVKMATCLIGDVRIDGKDNASLQLLNEDTREWQEVAHASTIGKGKIAVGHVVEVRFLYTTEGHRLCQPRIIEVRDDADASDCTMSQLRGTYEESVQEAA